MTLFIFIGILYGFLSLSASIHLLIEYGPLSENETINMVAIVVLSVAAGLITAAIWPVVSAITLGYSLYLLYRRFKYLSQKS